MEKSSKQRRIHQSCVVALPLKESLVEGWSTCDHGGATSDYPGKHGNANCQDCTCLERVLRRHKCLLVENNSTLKRVHGMLVFKLSRQLAKGRTHTEKKETLSSLEKLYCNSVVADLVEQDEKVIVTNMIKRILADACHAEQSADETMVLCVNILHVLFASSFDWGRMKNQDFHDILMALIRISEEPKTLQLLELIKARTAGRRNQEVNLILQAILSSKSVAQAPPEDWDEPDQLFALMKLATKLQMRNNVDLDQEAVSQLVQIASSDNELQRMYATNCLVIAGQKCPSREDIFESLVRVLINGKGIVTDTAMSAALVLAISDPFKFLSLDSVRTRQKELVSSLIQAIRDNSHGSGKNTSIQCSKLLITIFSAVQSSDTELQLSDVVAICTSLIDNPHVKVSLQMCNALLEYLSSMRFYLDDNHLMAISILAKFILDKGFEEPSLEFKVIRYYLQLTKERQENLTELARVPYFLESIVCITQENRGHEVLTDKALQLLIEFSRTPLNWKRLASTSGVIPLLVRHVQNSESDTIHEADSELPSRETFKECIQNLASAI